MALSDRVVVMHGGKILQIGAPEEIYQRPVSRMVAAFFGSPNLLEAKVTSCQPEAGGRFDLTVDGKGWQGHARAGEKFEVGAPVLVLVRPENIQIGTQAAIDGAQMSWSGKVVNAIFRGPRTSIAIDTGGPRLNVEAPALLRARVGDEVKIAVPVGGATSVMTRGSYSTAVIPDGANA